MKSHPKFNDAGNIPSWDSSWHHNDYLQFIVTLTEPICRIFVVVFRAGSSVLTLRQGPKDNLGSDWFNMPRTNLTPELKRDLQILRMRDVVAMGKQFFKKDSRKNLIPEYCQVGTIVAGATDGVNGRLTRKEKKRTIVEEVLSGENLAKFKSKYHDIQDQKMSGRKGYYKKLVAGRRKRNG